MKNTIFIRYPDIRPHVILYRRIGTCGCSVSAGRQISCCWRSKRLENLRELTDVSAVRRRRDVGWTRGHIRRHNKTYGGQTSFSGAEILGLDLFGEPATPVYWQIWLPNYAGPSFQPSMTIADVAFNRPLLLLADNVVVDPSGALKTPPSTPEVHRRQGGGGLSPGTLRSRQNWNQGSCKPRVVTVRCRCLHSSDGNATIWQKTTASWPRRGLVQPGLPSLTAASLGPRTYRRRRCPLTVPAAGRTPCPRSPCRPGSPGPHNSAARYVSKPVQLARRIDRDTISRCSTCKAGVSADPPRPRSLLRFGHYSDAAVPRHPTRVHVCGWAALYRRRSGPRPILAKNWTLQYSVPQKCSTFLRPPRKAIYFQTPS